MKRDYPYVETTESSIATCSRDEWEWWVESQEEADWWWRRILYYESIAEECVEDYGGGSRWRLNYGAFRAYAIESTDNRYVWDVYFKDVPVAWSEGEWAKQPMRKSIMHKIIWYEHERPVVEAQGEIYSNENLARACARFCCRRCPGDDDSIRRVMERLVLPEGGPYLEREVMHFVLARLQGAKPVKKARSGPPVSIAMAYWRP